MICAFFFEAVEGPEAAGGDMSSDEAEEIGRTMTTNDELRLCGLAPFFWLSVVLCICFYL
jgi:hypothetical protein